MSADFLGRAWRLPIGADASGRVVVIDHEEAIRQSVWTILSTAPGERLMRPDFGCGIHELVFSVNDAGTVGRVGSAVRDALLRWEPRIETIEVHVEADAAEREQLLIAIDYRVRATNSRFNLVYPFYLG